jgi:hypothetical protein
MDLGQAGTWITDDITEIREVGKPSLPGTVLEYHYRE